jgi:hypothetical protein
MFAGLDHASRFEVMPGASGSDDFAGDIQKRHRTQFTRFHKLLQSRFEAFLRDKVAAETTLGSDDQAQSGGDIPGSIDQGGPRRFLDAKMLSGLPAQNDTPDNKQQYVDKPGPIAHGDLA